MPFYSKSQLIRKLEKLDIRLDKSRGQCYLIDRNIVELIIANAQIDEKKDIILEIGPGFGTLTDRLVETSHQVILIEFDRKIAQELKESLSSHNSFLYLENPTPMELSKLDRDIKVILIHADVLKIELPVATKIVANIPYHISAPLIFQIIESWKFESVHLMVQKEFAERLIALPNSSQYSRLSAATGLFIDVEIQHKVPASCFYPRPKVESCLITLIAKKTLYTDSNEFQYKSEYLGMLKGIFPFKNKSLRNALLQFFKNAPEEQIRLQYLSEMIKNHSEYPFLQRKVRSFSSEELFSLLFYGLTKDLSYKVKIKNNQSFT